MESPELEQLALRLARSAAQTGEWQDAGRQLIEVAAASIDTDQLAAKTREAIQPIAASTAAKAGLGVSRRARELPAPGVLQGSVNSPERRREILEIVGRRNQRQAAEKTTPSDPSSSPRVRQLPVRGRLPRGRVEPIRKGRGRKVQPRPYLVGEVFAARSARSNRGTALALLQVAGLDLEREHLVSLEARLTAGTTPDQYYAALSARLVLKGLADHCFPAREQVWVDRSGRQHDVGDEHVKNRLNAFVDSRLTSALTVEEHRFFVVQLDTVHEWSRRGPHLIRRQGEGAQQFLRLLEVLAVIARAYGTLFSPQPTSNPAPREAAVKGAQRPTPAGG